MSLQVIGAGFGRTGTASLRQALVALGFGPCYHMFEIRNAPWKARPWYRIAQGEAADWDAIFQGYQAAVDWPSVRYYRELKAHFPDAKVVLTVRDSASWYASARDTIYAVSRVLPPWVRRSVPVMRGVYAMLEAVIWSGTFAERFEDADYAQKVYEEHIASVQREIPADDLLVFDVKDGWAPLCAFLGVPVPQGEPFPFVNEAKDIKRQVVALRLAYWAVSISMLCGVGALVWSLAQWVAAH